MTADRAAGTLFGLTLSNALAVPDRDSDPCRHTSQGSIAAEAFATGRLCSLFYPDDPLATLLRAARTVGDSDSIACLTGTFAYEFGGA